GYDDASVEHISYAQCALLDETVMSRKSEKSEEGEEPKVDEGQVAWRKAPLQARFFGSLRAGEALWDRIAEVLRQPSPNPAVLTCYHRVIALGFQGLYSLKAVSQSQRDEVVKALSERVSPPDTGLSLVVHRMGKHRWSLMRSVWFWIV
ncbi:type VI secretion system protein TssL, short form, partial [Salmonella enterica]|nr:type VI secretion system protein TssL, short form [Salmonella enterica]